MSIGDRLLFILITGFGTGLAPVASGTFGTLPAVAVGWLMQHYWFDKDNKGMALALMAVAAVLFVVGCSTTSFVDRVLQAKDPKAFVLDEIVGYFIALGILCFFQAPTLWGHFWCFFFFRLFDVLKPPPARQMDRDWKGAPGIMSDDAMAGIYAGVVLIVLHYTELI